MIALKQYKFASNGVIHTPYIIETNVTCQPQKRYIFVNKVFVCGHCAEFGRPLALALLTINWLPDTSTFTGLNQYAIQILAVPHVQTATKVIYFIMS